MDIEIRDAASEDAGAITVRLDQLGYPCTEEEVYRWIGFEETGRRFVKSLSPSGREKGRSFAPPSAEYLACKVDVALRPLEVGVTARP
jgi:hypothetical protein